MAFQITNEWLLPIPEDFEHQVKKEQVVFWKTGMTVATVVFSIQENTGKLELLNQIQSKMPDDVIEKLVSPRGEIVGLGYTRIQNYQDEKDRLSLITFTASDKSCLQMAFYMDDAKDLEWAKSIWQETVYHPAADQENKPSSL